MTAHKENMKSKTPVAGQCRFCGSTKGASATWDIAFFCAECGHVTVLVPTEEVKK